MLIDAPSIEIIDGGVLDLTFASAVWGHPPQGSGSTSLNCACHPDFPLSEKWIDP
jgi:hypothetical protein